LTHKTILYVEDNSANVAFMKDLAEMLENIELLTASTAESGIELARTRRPALIIMDVNLPGMSGVEALHLLRGMAETKAIPVIALSAAATPLDKQSGIQAGFRRYLTKPVNIDELVDELEAALASAP
jgi:CheY-like chemotaxis protein